VILEHINVRLFVGSVKQSLARYDQRYGNSSEDEKILNMKQPQTTRYEQVMDGLRNHPSNGTKHDNRNASEKPKYKTVLENAQCRRKNNEQNWPNEATNPEWCAD